VNPLARYMNWLHTRWPAGRVEKMPEVGEDGATRVPGVRIVGDLTGIPLLKFSTMTGAKAVRAFVHEGGFEPGRGGDGTHDLVIVGAGVSGMAAALEAKNQGLDYRIFDASEPFTTIDNFPKAKPIYTYPTDLDPDSPLEVSADVKEALLDELRGQTRDVEVESVRIEKIQRRHGTLHVVPAGGGEAVRAQRVVVAIGRSGNYRRLGVPGQDRDKVYHRLYDPKDYRGQRALVVGGGDSAAETAIALAGCGADVTLSYRKPELSRPKPENVHKLKELEADPGADVGVEDPASDRVNAASGAFIPRPAEPGRLRLMLGSQLREVRDEEVELVDADGQTQILGNDVVFAMIGREPPLDFFRRSGIPVSGDWRPATYASFAAFLAFCVFLFLWKSGGPVYQAFAANDWFPFFVPDLMTSLSDAAAAPSTLLGTLAISMKSPGFYYTFAYCACVVIFGIDRVRRKRTPYVEVQTAVLALIQTIPLFLLPYVILPLLGHNGLFDQGFGKTVADNLFPEVGYAHGREYWRAFGLVLAWPLFIWNFFTDSPLGWWLVIGTVQTFVLIPAIIYYWGKGAYCGWICSCGALAETLGDRHRHKMPHGPEYNRLNMVGQAVLAVAFLLLGLRIVAWSAPGSTFGRASEAVYRGLLTDWSLLGVQLNYQSVVDITMAGIIGVGFYFWFSGRVWCRFACPLAALMHVYARFSRFRIFPEKSKCISCNVCTAVCHQGIDIMSFANKGLPMEDPECVRCSACVQSCPTGVLAFGRYTADGTIALDSLQASAVRAKEKSAAPA